MVSDQMVKHGERLGSFLMGRDSDAIERLLRVHCPLEAPRILDCTHNTGKMWKGSSRHLVRMDIDPNYGVDVVGDFTAMPFDAASFDIIVFDPPHLPVAAASPGSSGILRDIYGITERPNGRDGDNVGGMFAPFCREAQRVLRPGGIVLAKIADIVHNHRYQWQHIDLILAARAAGMTPCDVLIKRDPCGGNLKSSKWQRQHHLRNEHCYWIVIRNSTRCE